MASRSTTTPLEKITTTKILKTLQQAYQQDDSTSFFYLHVSTGGTEDSSQLVPGQPTHDRDHTTDSGRDDPDSVENNDKRKDLETAGQHVDTTTNTSQRLPTEDIKKAKNHRKRAMDEVHQAILPKVLCRDGWKKVYDKDEMPTYRALYFNKIERKPNESEVEHNRRVGEVRVSIREKVKELQASKPDINFKNNTLLSRAILYDDPE